MWICECLGTPFSLLTSVPLVLKPILTFSKGRNKLLYFVKDFFSQSLQPPLVLPRRGDAGYSGSVKDWLVQVTLVVDKPLTIRRLQTNNKTANGICPSPTGEARWGLMSICRVSTPIPPGKEVPKHLQILLNPNITNEISSKNESVKRPIRVPLFNPCFLFLICGPAEGWGHNDDTELQYHISENNVSVDLR